MDLKEIMKKSVGRFADKKADWNAFPDTKDEGFKRAQFRMVGSGGARINDPNAIEADKFTVSIMCVPPGQGGRSHAHEVVEAFFMLKGHCIFFMEDDNGNREEVRLGPWDIIHCPPDIYHGFYNDGVENAFMQVIVGTKELQPIRFKGLE